MAAVFAVVRDRTLPRQAHAQPIASTESHAGRTQRDWKSTRKYAHGRTAWVAAFRYCCALAIALLGLVLAPAMPATAQTEDPGLILSRDSSRYPLTSTLTYLVDAEGQLDFVDAQLALAHDKFQSVVKPTFGFAHGAYWFHAKVTNADHPDREWLLAVEYSLLDRISLYVRSANGTITEQHSGDLLPFESRAVKDRHPNFNLKLGQGESVDLFLRVATKSSMQVPLTLHTRDDFAAEAHEWQIGIGLYYGILLALFFYNLILFASLRDANHLYYILHVLGFGLVQAALNGVAFEYLWPNWPQFSNTVLPVLMAFAMLALVQFARSFLDLQREWPLGDKLILALVAIESAIMVAAPFLDYRIAVLAGTLSVFLVIPTVIVCGVRCALNGSRPARLFLLAWTLMLLGTLAYASVSFDALPKNFVTEYGMQIGSAAEMILLSFALAFRIRLLTEENQRITKEAQEQLETRVKERTYELNGALTQLADANQRLREFSLRDGLTGVYNRRYLDHALDEHLRVARDNDAPLSLFMVDIDRFKQINDEHGHQIGDDCLRSVAQTIGQSLRNPDEVVARFGGEEFLVLLPNVDSFGAERRAEELLGKIAAARVTSEGTTLTVTVSIGVATVHPRAAVVVSDLVRMADKAMYEAKHLGRNRVVRAA